MKLGSSGQKKKRWSLVAIAVFVAAVAGTGVWYFTSHAKLFTSEEKVVYGVTEKSRSLFHRYINFLLDDEDSTDKPDRAFVSANSEVLKPIGVSEYHLCTDLPLDLKSALPDPEEIRSRIDMKK